jgi:hypothetical protein
MIISHSVLLRMRSVSCKSCKEEQNTHFTFNNFFPNSGRFMMFSVITNIYNKKTNGLILMEFFTASGILKVFFWTTRDVRCVHHGSHATHQWYSSSYNARVNMAWSLQQWKISMHSCWCVCGNKLNIVSMCAVSPVVHTSNISSCQKNFFSFHVAVNNSINIGPLVFFL